MIPRIKGCQTTRRAVTCNSYVITVGGRGCSVNRARKIAENPGNAAAFRNGTGAGGRTRFDGLKAPSRSRGARPGLPKPESGYRRPERAAVRISGGIARGVLLAVPKGDVVRPATDGMRQAVFSSLGTRVVGAFFWDLFAGSGAYGLEALSRGATGGVFVERNPKALGCLTGNLAAAAKSIGRTLDSVRAVEADVLSWVSQEQQDPADLVFVDPPYEIVPIVAPALFPRLTRALASRPEALVLFELPGEINLAPEGWSCVKRVGKGAHQPTVAVFRRS